LCGDFASGSFSCGRCGGEAALAAVGVGHLSMANGCGVGDDAGRGESRQGGICLGGGFTVRGGNCWACGRSLREALLFEAARTTWARRSLLERSLRVLNFVTEWRAGASGRGRATRRFGFGVEFFGSGGTQERRIEVIRHSVRAEGECNKRDFNTEGHGDRTQRTQRGADKRCGRKLPGLFSLGGPSRIRASRRSENRAREEAGTLGRDDRYMDAGWGV